MWGLNICTTQVCLGNLSLSADMQLLLDKCKYQRTGLQNSLRQKVKIMSYYPTELMLESMQLYDRQPRVNFDRVLGSQCSKSVIRSLTNKRSIAF